MACQQTGECLLNDVIWKGASKQKGLPAGKAAVGFRQTEMKTAYYGRIEKKD